MFAVFLSEGGEALAATVETREGVSRRGNGDERRHARHITYSQVPELPDSSSESLREKEEEAVEEEGTEGLEPETAATDDMEPIQRPRTKCMVGATRGRLISSRHNSILSTTSSRSSGYFSNRDSVLSMQSHIIYDEETEKEYSHEEQEESQQEEREKEEELDQQHSLPKSASFHSSSSSFTEEEFRSVRSASLSSISTLDCDSLPRGFTTTEGSYWYK